jgi:Holliday junction resolvase
MPVEDRVVRSDEFEKMVAQVLRKAGWRVRRPSSAADKGPDLVFDTNGKTYVVQLKSSSEGRGDRLIPLLSQAILQARAFAQHFPGRAAPIAVVAAKHIPASVADQIKQFAERYAPEVGVGVIDAEGFRSFVGPGLEGLDFKPPRRATSQILSPQRLPDLFSDLNQWMLKILLGQHLPEALILVPRREIRNASQLAEAAKVSVMSASRFVNQLENRGFLDESEEKLQIVRVEELLELWISANREAMKEVAARWIIKGGDDQLRAALRRYSSRQIHNQPRCCLGLFAAADALGFGFVRGAPAHIYLERLTLDSLNRLGLAIDNSNRRPADVIVRIPVNRQAVFRPVVLSHDDVPVSDILQAWLDTSTHPARGREQAREIYRRVLKPLFGKSR